MLRNDIIDYIGRQFYTYSTESEEGEFFYKVEFQKKGMDWDSIKIKNETTRTESYYQDLDLRFVNKKKGITICIETKTDFKKTKKKKQNALEQLDAYMRYEKIYSGNIVIGILANTTYNDILIYKDNVIKSNQLDFEEMPTMQEIVDYLFPTIVNNKEGVLSATYKLNEILHGYGIEARIRGQFVGTCLLALKNGLDYLDSKKQPRETNVIIAEIKTILGKLLDKSINKAEKLTLLSKNVLENERVERLSKENLHDILEHINNKIIPYINDETTAGQDILNMFFTMFNKYVDKDDKNQAFTPDHITDFMTKITNVDYNSRVLDFCCGSGAFLVRALVQARNSCSKLKNRDELYERINKEHIYGIEYSEKPYGLATTNMLIHSDGNTNVIKANCFDKKDWIINTAKPTVILINPPYNAQRVSFPEEILDHTEYDKKKNGEIKKDRNGNPKEIKVLKTYSYGSWPKKDGKAQKEDPTKGLSFVEYISDVLHEGGITKTKLAVLLPLQCAIGQNGLILRAKQNILKHNTLEAVFTLPPEMFYPGASANACCMLFTMGEPHFKGDGTPRKETYFGYYKEDGFVKKKNLGRVEKLNSDGKSIWQTEIEPKWIEGFENKTVESGFSATAKVTAEDEWLAEAYMKTDYSKLTEQDFQTTLNNYLSYLVKEGKVYED